MKELLLTIARGLVENPDAVTVEQDEPAEDGTVVFHLRVAPGRYGPCDRQAGPHCQGNAHRDACRRNPPGYQGCRRDRLIPPAGRRGRCASPRGALFAQSQSKRGTNHAAKTVS